MRLDGKRILVLGASSGLGRAVAGGLARQGARLALAARRAEMVEAAADQVGNGARALVCDVSQAPDCERVVADAVDALGGLDGLVYAPALGTLARLATTDAQTWAEGFATNVTGAALVTSAALPFLEATHGRAVYFSSMTGTFTPPWPGLGLYGVTKAALERLVESWSIEHPGVAFTRLVIGPAVGDDHAPSEFGRTWDPDLANEILPTWSEMGPLAGHMVASDDLAEIVVTIFSLRSTLPFVAILPPKA